MKVLLLEYITAGGFNDSPLPASLLREGTLMRDALLRDFAAVTQVVVNTTYDHRLGKPALQYPLKIESYVVDANTNPIEMWLAILADCDAALVVAPETDGILLHLTQLIEKTSVINLGCDASSVKLTSSKLATCVALQQAGIETVSTYPAETFDVALNRDHFHQGYVLKPDDGAGCDSTWYFDNASDLDNWLQSHSELLSRFIVQPYQPGVPASLSMLCRDGKAWLLACNLQNVSKAEQGIPSDKTTDSPYFHFKYTGSQVNALTSHYAEFNALAQRIASMTPGLNGYVGVDVIIEDEIIHIVEINPRITTSYIGLQSSLQYNPAELILALLDEDFALPNTFTTHAVEITINA